MHAPIERRTLRSLVLLSGCWLLASSALGDEAKPTGVKEVVSDAANSAESTTKAEVIKKGLNGLVQVGRLGNPDTAAEAANEVAEAVARLEMDAKETAAFFERLQKMDKTELTNLVKQKGNGVLAYGQALLKGEGSDVARIKAALARGGDEASLEAVRLVRRLEEGVLVSKSELMKALQSLPPEKSTTLLNAFRSEIQAGGSLKKQLGEAIGTMVDGVFVFNDAVNIYYSDDPPEEKAAAATGKAVEYGVGAAGGVLVAAVSGGLGANLVLGWSAGQVGELTQEMIGLYNDRQNTALKEQWAQLELREMTLRKMLEIDRLIKAGKLAEANKQSKMLREFYDEHEKEIGDNALSKQLITLRSNLSDAEDKETALSRLNEARRPYERALSFYQKRQALKLAQQDAKEAREILSRWVERYPELKQALDQVRKLEADIAQAIASATPVNLVSIQGPSQVAIGQWATFYLNASGGIPFYCTPSDGLCGSTFATAYFKATGTPGERTVTFRITDDLEQTATKDLKLQLLPGTDEPVTAPPSATKTATTTGGRANQRAFQCCMKRFSGTNENAKQYCTTMTSIPSTRETLLKTCPN